MKDVNLIAYSISVLIALITFANTILNIIKEDTTKAQIINNIGLLFKSIWITLLYNVLYFSIIFSVSIIISNASKLNSTIISTILPVTIFAIGLSSLIVKTILENKYLITILENNRHREKAKDYKMNKIKLLFKSIDQDKLIDKQPNIQGTIDKINLLYNDINKDRNLNKKYDFAQSLSWIFYPSATLLSVGFALQTMKGSKDIPFIVLTFILLTTFNVLMLYRDLSINKGHAKISSNVIESHIYRYENELKKNKKHKVYSSNKSTDKTIK